MNLITEQEKIKVSSIQVLQFLSFYKNKQTDLDQILKILKPPPYQWPHRLSVLNAQSNLQTVGTRTLARWGCSGCLVDEKLFFFGGRTQDGKSKSSLHTIEMPSGQFSFIKLSIHPQARDGHSLVAYKKRLYLFGGCEGGEEQMAPLSDLWVYSIQDRSWTRTPTAGVKPDGRDGHAAGVIKNQMLIYGGCGGVHVFDDMRALDLQNLKWHKVAKIGDDPGPRESMGYTVIQNKLYVFSGNICHINEENTDIYSNDLYEISLQNYNAFCVRLEDDGVVPPERHSLSMCGFKQKHLIVFGGEGANGESLRDIWTYDLDQKFWKQIKVTSTLNKRMTSIIWEYKNSVYIYGGMDQRGKASSQLGILTFRDYVRQPQVRKKKQEMPRPSALAREKGQLCCKKCGHSTSTCEFIKTRPYLGFPYMNYFSKPQIPMSAIKILKEEYFDELSAILSIVRYFGNQKVVNLNSQVMPFRGKSILEISFSDLDLSANEVAQILSGCTKKDLLGPLLKISDSFLIISKTSQCITVGLCRKSEIYLKSFILVYNKNFKPIFPDQNILQQTIEEVFGNTHISQDRIFNEENGVLLVTYIQDLEINTDDLFLNNISLKEFFGYSSLKPKDYFVNRAPGKQWALEKQMMTQVESQFGDQYFIYSECSSFSVLIYYKKELIYWEVRSEIQNPRRKISENTIVIKTSNRKYVSKNTGLLSWDTLSRRIFYKIHRLSNQN